MNDVIINPPLSLLPPCHYRPCRLPHLFWCVAIAPYHKFKLYLNFALIFFWSNLGDLMFSFVPSLKGPLSKSLVRCIHTKVMP